MADEVGAVAWRRVRILSMRVRARRISLAAVARVEVFVDPSCPWAWITSRWLKDVQPHRDLALSWRSLCLEIRDDYVLPPTVPVAFRDTAIAARALGHRLLRIFEWLRAEGDEGLIDELYTAWGRKVFGPRPCGSDGLLAHCLEACGLDPKLIQFGEDPKWDAPIVEGMHVAYEFGGPKTQTPVIVVHRESPYGFKGPVMSSVPSEKAAVRLWDALEVLAQEPSFLEITRPRVNPPPPPNLR